MSVAVKKKPPVKARPWDTSLYARIVDVRVQSDSLIVLFADHTWAEVEVNRLLSGDRSQIHWDRTTFSPHEIVVPTEDGAVEISWLPIRSLTDAAFAAHLGAAAKESLQRIGRQIRQWRNERCMSVDALAHAAGLDAKILAQVERGELDTAYSMLTQILTPLGRALQDLALAAEKAGADSSGETEE